MDLNKEIRSLFATTTNMSASLIKSLPDTHQAWVIRIGNDFGVGVAYKEDTSISERFTSARMWTAPITIHNENYNFLMLTCQDEYQRTEFSAICAQFVDPEERKNLLESPYTWWDRWRNLLGNSVKNKTPHGVLGELITMRKLWDLGEGPVWTGGEGGVNDIQCGSSEYEVKSTTIRYDSIVSITGQFQLDYHTSDSLYLIFCRFESSLSGESINDVVHSLVQRGMEEQKLEAALEKCGYEAGSSARTDRYKLLEMRKYKVDDSFPAITAKSFAGGQIPEAVVQFTYRLELAGLPYESWI
ncbi:PD-(D/E)XK motif protein [Paenibacillus vini]|uniref:PD-(D/E)XK motif protein n=1 Tax=Paenibacillus vini TaxID=1476024 RepID=UPI0025B67FB4|nr:PD-(D/E)XK motif protein [Paenibacillus vini]MDN4066665.1 PD-(D/E)XK motif protein [Paenibacillus vini]